MKTNILSLAVTVFMAGTIMSGCQSRNDKLEAARNDLQDARQDLRVAEKDANLEVQNTENVEEWKTFKREAEARIKVNEARIDELRVKMKSSGKAGDEVYEKKIGYLEQKNRNLKERINVYDKNQSGWGAFKREFNHDMDDLGKSLKDFTGDNKK